MQKAMNVQERDNVEDHWKTRSWWRATDRNCFTHAIGVVGGEYQQGASEESTKVFKMEEDSFKRLLDLWTRQFRSYFP